jgi:uncharacterized protein (TIGR03084 family)
MRDVEDCLAAQHAELDALLAGLAEEQWPTRVPDCPAWDVADVVLHLAQSDAVAIASLDGSYPQARGWSVGSGHFATVDDAVAAAVTAERDGLTPPALLTRWRTTAAALRGAFASTDPKKQVTWVAGQFSARTLATTRLAEAWIHTNDIATALSVPRTDDDRLWHIARLAWRTIPYAYARAGLTPPPAAVALHLSAPDNAEWHFGNDTAPNQITGPALDFCLVAARRRAAGGSLHAEGPDAATVLDVVRTWA